jgi:hypothetical protein
MFSRTQLLTGNLSDMLSSGSIMPK